MIDIKRFIELQAKKCAEVSHVNGNIVIAFKKFDPATGEERAAEVQSVDAEELKNFQADLQQQIDNVDVILASIDIEKSKLPNEIIK